MFTNINDFLNAYVAFPGWEADNTVVQPIMTIVVDGTPYLVSGSNQNNPTVADIIDTINASTAGQFVFASPQLNVQTGFYELSIVPRVTTVTTLSVLNDQTLIFNRAQLPQSSSASGTFVTSVGAVSATPRSFALNDQLEPKNTGSVLEQVHIPLHTEIISDDVVVDINYWANLKADVTDTYDSAASSVVTVPHPTTSEPLVYASYIAGDHVLIEARYASGARAGQLASNGVNGPLGILPIHSSWYDAYWGNAKVLSATLAYNPRNGQLILKSILSGMMYVDANLPSQSTTVLTVCEIDKLLTTDVSWYAMYAHDDLMNKLSTGFGSYQRSEGGVAFDNDNNIVVVSNIMIPRTNAYFGTQETAPGLDIIKLSSTGTELWSNIIESGQYVDTDVNDVYTIPGGGYSSNATFSELPASVAIASDGSIFASHGRLFHKITSTGDLVWTKEFDQLNINGLSSGAARYISSILVHPQTGHIFVGIAGFPDATSEALISGIVKFTDTVAVGASDAVGMTWFQPQVVAGFDAPWTSGDRFYMHMPLVMKLDVSSDRIYAATVVRDNGSTGRVTGDITISAINATTMDIVWTNDVSISALDIANDNVYLSGTMQISSSFDEQHTGYTTLDVVQSQNNTTGICYCAPLYIGEGNVSTTRPGGLVVSQFDDHPTVASRITGNDARYMFNDNTNIDIEWDISNQRPTAVSVWNGTPIAADPTTHITYVRHITNAGSTSVSFNGYTDKFWTLPPINVVNNDSLYVKNIAEVGELVLGGLMDTPTSLVGSPADRTGAFRVDNTGMFYCHSAYDGATEIWAKVPFGAAGGRIRTTLPGFNPNNGNVIGCPGDVAGDIFVLPTCVLRCVADYDGTSQIWEPIVPVMSNGLTYSYTTDWTYDSSDPVSWPKGAHITQYSAMTYSSASNSAPVDVRGWCIGKPPANGIINTYIAARQVRVNSNNAHLLWRCLTPATNAQLFNIEYNGSTIGQMRFAPGSYVGQLWWSWDVIMQAGDRISVRAPAAQDATLSDVSFNMFGFTL